MVPFLPPNQQHQITAEQTLQSLANKMHSYNVQLNLTKSKPWKSSMSEF